MADQGFPGQTTTVTSSTTTVQTSFRFDLSYIRTIPGILKCVQLLLNILIFLCVACSRYSGLPLMGFLSFLGGFGFWFTGILLALYLFHAIEKFYKVPWLRIEFVYCAIWTFFYLIGASCATGNVGGDGGTGIFAALAFFGYANMIAYGIDSFLKFKAHKNGEIAQGERRVEKTTTTSNVASPVAY